MVGEAMAGLSVFKSLLNGAKGLKDLNDAAVRNAAVIELQENILTAQAAQAALIERIRELEEEVARLETWKAEKQRYQLTELPPGIYVYRVKEEARGTEPPHSLCATCYANDKKSILQSDEPINGRTKMHCPSCGQTFRIGHRQPIEMRQTQYR